MAQGRRHYPPGVAYQVDDRDVQIGVSSQSRVGRLADFVVGIGALVLNGAVVGEESIVAAGALVPEGMEVPPGSVVHGLWLPSDDKPLAGGYPVDALFPGLIALMLGREVFLLDEATSALDSLSEQLIQEALNRILANKTAIIVAHRLSAFRSVDRVIVLDEGRVIEEGSHDELVAAGRADATWTLVPKHEWDIAAGVALIQAAGGEVYTLDRKPPRFNRPKPKVTGLVAHPLSRPAAARALRRMKSRRFNPPSVNASWVAVVMARSFR